MSSAVKYTADEALEKLKAGNARYLGAAVNAGDISAAIREKTCTEGQFPYAVVITCSDSRVIPESIFSAGIGELFVIRVAGNVIDKHQLGSVEYAVEHLGSPLVLVMGHDNCGAVGAAIGGGAEGFIKSITDEIKAAIGGETDPFAASCLNVRHSVKVIEESLKDIHGLRVCAAIYHIADGQVEFL